MKRFRVALAMAIAILFFFLNTQAQAVNNIPNADVLPSLPLSVCLNKTTNLVFPYKIKSVDIGSKDLLVQKAKGVENILLVKAAKENFEETNLSIVTGDGRLYSFSVNYAGHPVSLNLLFLKDSSITKDMGIQISEACNEATLETDAQYIMEQERIVFGIKDKNYGMKMRLIGVYIKDDVLYFNLELQNRSAISYDIDMLHFFIKDRKLARRTASQEIPVQPIYMYGNNIKVKADTSQFLIYALPKFTIPDKKWFYVQMMEKNGGRHLHLRIGNRTVINAKPLPGASSTALH